MSDVSPLHPGIKVNTGKPNEALCDALRTLLKMAESGQLQHYIGTGFTSDGLRVATWCDFHDDVYQALGSLEWIKQEYIFRHTD